MTHSLFPLFSTRRFINHQKAKKLESARKSKIPEDCIRLDLRNSISDRFSKFSSDVATHFSKYLSLKKKKNHLSN